MTESGTSDANLMPVTPWKEPVPAAHGLVVRIGELAGHPAFFGAFRTSTPKSDGGEPFATIILARLCPKGGTLQRQFRLTYMRDTNDVWGGFAVPLSALDAINPLPPSRYVLFVLVGDESATMSVVQIP